MAMWQDIRCLPMPKVPLFFPVVRQTHNQIDTISGYEGRAFTIDDLWKALGLSAGTKSAGNKAFGFSQTRYADELDDIISWMKDKDGVYGDRFNGMTIAELTRIVLRRQSGDRSDREETSSEASETSVALKNKKQNKGKQTDVKGTKKARTN